MPSGYPTNDFIVTLVPSNVVRIDSAQCLTRRTWPSASGVSPAGTMTSATVTGQVRGQFLRGLGAWFTHFDPAGKLRAGAL